MSDVDIKIGADTSEAKKSLDAFQKSSQSTLSSIENSFGKIRTAAIAAVTAFAAKNVFDFFKGGVDAAAEAEVSFSRLTKALELSGNAAPGVAESFVQLSDNIERVTGISAESIQEQTALAQSFGLTNGETQKLIIAATELSAATGKDLASSVKDLGNTFNGTLGPLKKTVPELQALDENALASGKAIDFVLERFSGSAAKNLDTFSGSVEQVGIAFGKIPEAFGTAVVENANLKRALDVLTEAFYAIADIVNQNQGFISGLVDLALKPLMIVIGSIVKGAGMLNTAINGWSLAFASLGKIVLETIAVAKEFDAFIAKVTFGGRNYKQAREEADAAKISASEYTVALRLLNDQAIKEKKAFDDVADSIFNYDKITKATTKSIDKLSIAESGASKGRVKAAKDIKEIEKAFDSLNKKIVGETLDALEKQLAAYEDNMDELDKIQASGLISLEKTNALRLKIIQAHESNVGVIQKKAAEERKKEIDGVINETSFTGLVKLVLAEGTAADLQKEAKTKIGTIVANVGASVVSSVAQGEKGFSNLVVNLVKAIPIFGNLIAAVIELGTLSPEENENAIKGFVEGIGKSMENLNTNLGALPGILSDVVGPLIEKILGPLFTGLVTNLIKSLREWPRLVGVIAKGVAAGIRAQAGSLAEAIKKAFSDIGAEFTRAFEGIRTFFGTFSEQVRGAFAFVFASNPLLDELRTMRSGITQLTNLVNFFVKLFSSIPGILIQIRDLFNGLGEQFAGLFSNLGSKITDGWLLIRDGISGLFSGIINAIKELPNRIKAAFGNFYNGIKNAVADAFASFFASFKSFSEKVSKFFSGGIQNVGGGGGGSFGETLESLIPGRAKGLTEVPPGFPNDSYLARLQSGERVVDSDTNGDLKEFLSRANQGGLSSDEAIGLLRQIAANISGNPKVVQVTIDKKVIGQAVLDNNRRNERLAVR